MKKIIDEVEVNQEIKGSKFITYLFKCAFESDAKDKISSVKKLHPKANHHCYAYIVESKTITRSYDDGEPSSTAGQPILQVLQGHDLEDVLAVVVRYFGGTLLGKGGLIRAYSSSVVQALEASGIQELRCYKQYSLTFPYAYTSMIEHLLQSNCEIVSRDFGEEMTIVLNIVEFDTIHLPCLNMTKGQCTFEFITEFWK